MLVQVLLVLADPGDVAVGAQQDRRNIQCCSGIRGEVEPVRPAADAQTLGAVEYQPAAPVEQAIELALFQVHVGHASAEQVGPEPKS